MNDKSRMEYSAHNTTVGLISRITAILCGYIVRIVFTHVLSKITAENMKAYLAGEDVPVTFLYNTLNTEAIKHKGNAVKNCYTKGMFNIVSSVSLVGTTFLGMFTMRTGILSSFS